VKRFLASVLVLLAFAFPRPSLAQEGGAGARDYGRAVDDGGVAALSPIQGNDRAALDQKEAALDKTRFSRPLVLAEDELTKLLAARGGPSETIGSGADRAAQNFEKATRLVNDFVRSGVDLTLERIDEINRTLLDGTDEGGQAGVTRDKSGIHHYDMWTHKDFGAAPDLVASYLGDFMRWYPDAEKRAVAPVEIAAEAYQQLVRIHPYLDANGRTTRLVMDWILQKHGLPPATFEAGSKAFEAIHAGTAELVKNTVDAVSAAASKLAELPSYVSRLEADHSKPASPTATDTAARSTTTSDSTIDPAQIRTEARPGIGISQVLGARVQAEDDPGER
jgi:fido (protein-threonine AMPylation protein)